MAPSQCLLRWQTELAGPGVELLWGNHSLLPTDEADLGLISAPKRASHRIIHKNHWTNMLGRCLVVPATGLARLSSKSTIYGVQGNFSATCSRFRNSEPRWVNRMERADNSHTRHLKNTQCKRPAGEHAHRLSPATKTIAAERSLH